MLKVNLQVINISINNISIKSNFILREKRLGWEFHEVGSWSGLFPIVGYRSKFSFYQESSYSLLCFLNTHLVIYSFCRAKFGKPNKEMKERIRLLYRFSQFRPIMKLYYLRLWLWNNKEKITRYGFFKKMIELRVKLTFQV